MLPKILPFVDKALIVVGREDIKAISYLTSLGDKVRIVFRPWDDNFANQWNAYLPHIDSGWILLCDDDEVPSDGMLHSLEGLINNSEKGEKYSLVKFQANPITEEQDLGPSNYYREMLFRKSPRMKYAGGQKTGCHQYLTGYQNSRVKMCPEVYYHIKSLKEEYRNAARNYFIYGIWLHGSTDGVQREEWHEMKEILSRIHPEVQTFMDLDPLLIAGTIGKELKEWLVRTYLKYKDHNEYNEMRAFTLYYAKYLHPEENLL